MAGRPVATMVVMPFGHIKNHFYPFQLKAVLGKNTYLQTQKSFSMVAGGKPSLSCACSQTVRLRSSGNDKKVFTLILFLSSCPVASLRLQSRQGQNGHP